MTGKLRHQIILSGGMPRAGSGWFYNLTLDLWLAAGRDNIREIREQYHLESVMTEVNHNIVNFSPRRTLQLMRPYLAGKSFTIKIHPAPWPPGRLLIRAGIIRPTYIYRDPRDALLSAYDYGRRIIEERGRTNAFSHLDTFDKAIDFMRDYMPEWEVWMTLAAPDIFRYEDVLADFDAEVKRLTTFLEVDSEDPAIKAAIEKNRPKAAAQKTGTHFHKGKVGRFREVFSPEQIARCEEIFGPWLVRMGYEI